VRISIRPLTTIRECRAVAALEREIWGFSGSDDVVPPWMLIVSVKRGGILLGAFDEADTLVGFVYSVPGIKDERPTQWSHMLGVVERVRESGLGARLKLAQRDQALQQGLDLVEWTFDPLMAANAHFNFAKLGVVVSEYDENVYGDSSSPLHAGTPTDRFVAEWHIRKPHVERRIAAAGLPTVRDQSVSGAILVNPSSERGSRLTPGRADLTRDDRRLLAEIPADFLDTQQADRDLALAWRLQTREIFQHYFARGYRVVDFFLSREAGRGHYLMVREDRQA